MEVPLPDPDWDEDDRYYWPSRKFGMQLEDIFTTLHEEFNTWKMPILGPLRFHSVVLELSRAAYSKEDFFRRLKEKRDEGAKEMTRCWDQFSQDILWGTTTLSEQQLALARDLIMDGALEPLSLFIASLFVDKGRKAVLDSEARTPRTGAEETVPPIGSVESDDLDMRGQTRGSQVNECDDRGNNCQQPSSPDENGHFDGCNSHETTHRRSSSLPSSEPFRPEHIPLPETQMPRPWIYPEYYAETFHDDYEIFELSPTPPTMKPRSQKLMAERTGCGTTEGSEPLPSEATAGKISRRTKKGQKPTSSRRVVKTNRRTKMGQKPTVSPQLRYNLRRLTEK